MIESKEQFFAQRKRKSKFVDYPGTDEKVEIFALSVSDKEGYLDYVKANSDKHIRWLAYAICCSVPFLEKSDVDEFMGEVEDVTEITTLGSQVLELSGMAGEPTEQAEKN